MITNYVTIDSIIERLNRSSISGGYWNKEEIIEWTFDALRDINTKLDKVEMVDTLEIIDYKCQLPLNLTRLLEVKDNESGYEIDEINIGDDHTDFTYKINNGYLYVDFEEGAVDIRYLAYPEQDGMPLIPDTNYYIAAVIAFLRFKIGERAYGQGKILSNELQLLEQEWLFCLPAAQCSNKMNIMLNQKKFRKIHNRHWM